MLSSFYTHQLASIKANITQKMGDDAKVIKVKTTAKQVTAALVKIAVVTDPMLWPVLQAGFDQLKGLYQLIRSGNNN